MKNVLLTEFVADNLCCLVTAVYELGLEPVFTPRPDPPGDGPPFPVAA